MSTFLELVAAWWVENGLEGEPPTTVLNQTGMKKRSCYWIQRADMEVQNRWQNWDFLFASFSATTIATVAEINAPVDLGMWDRESFYLAGERLSFIAYERWRDVYGRSTATGQPWGYTIDKKHNLILVPTPDAAYALTADYYKSAQKMTESTSSTPIPARFERAILAKASEYYARSEEIPLLLQEAKQEFYEVVNKMEAVYLPNMQTASVADNEDYLVLD